MLDRVNIYPQYCLIFIKMILSRFCFHDLLYATICMLKKMTLLTFYFMNSGSHKDDASLYGQNDIR